MALKKDYTKAESLLYLKLFEKKLNYKIPKLIYFTKKDYYKNSTRIINNIKNIFKNRKVIIRSSSLQEDSLKKSNAGKFKSFKNLQPNKNILLKYINIVANDFKNKDDQIIIQEFVSTPKFSGVIFTRNINNNSPYYFINIDKSGLTDLITSGKSNPSMKTIIVNRNKIARSGFFSKYLKIIKKIENKFKNDRLDIEFCIKNNKLYILQCRPLKFIKKVNENKIREALTNIEKKIFKIKKRIPYLPGKTTYFSNMSDWNPAEMIGVKPSYLSLSLYSELITDDVWSEQRYNYGYKDVRPNPLMLNLGGSPYIDLRVDFNSFLPSKLPTNIQEKAINFYLSKIRSNPDLHDKIEFEIVETCYDFNSKSKLKTFLNEKETNIYLNNLRELTNNIIKKNSEILKKEIKKIKELDNKIYFLKKSKISEIQKIFFFVKDCKRLGTLSFAGIARCAFIATKILRSLVDNKILSQENLENFYESVFTITKRMNFLYQNIKGKKNRKLFLNLYGHVRPSTYSIVSKNYSENLKKYFSNSVKKEEKVIKKFKLTLKQKKEVNKIFKLHKLKTNDVFFFKFAKNVIFYREYAKLIFTKSIDQVFKNLIKFSKEVGISRADLENLSIKNFLNYYSNVDIEKLKKILKSEIIKNKKNYKILNMIEFPEVIKDKKDLFYHEQISKAGNYITTKTAYGETAYIKKIKNFTQLNNKIVFLENADPGYDFIFSYKIKGLITEYGGSNSHMSIRCLELGIPAIIGIGSKEFKYLLSKNVIEINSKQKYYKILS